MKTEIQNIVERVLIGAVEKILRPAIEKVIYRCLEVRINELDLQLIELDKLRRAFWWIGEDYCLNLTKKQIFTALDDYQKAERERNERWYRGHPGIDRRVLQ